LAAHPTTPPTCAAGCWCTPCSPPNPHNRQSWIADLKRDAEITLVCDADRLLPETDPFGRQVLIGCGAFIEPAVIAAAERGHRVSVDLFPEGAPNRRELPGGSTVARLRVAPDAALRRDPLFGQIRRRHTHKGPYDSARAVPSPLWRGLEASATERGLMAGSIDAPAPMATLRRITRDSFEIEMLAPRT